MTVNPLRPGTDHAANDGDVEIARYHVGDFDGVEQAIDYQGFPPRFIVNTGTTPLLRFQGYWFMSDVITDLAQWQTTQKGVIQHIGCDKVVKNPARVLRLAGSVSYPPRHKRERGYITELTSLTNGGGDVCKDSFAASFPYTKPASEMPPKAHQRASGAETSSRVPLCVVKGALDAIPPIMGKNNRDLWLDISQCARDANPNCFPEFDAWQRGSDRDHPDDSKHWPLKKEPRPGYISACSSTPK